MAWVGTAVLALGSGGPPSLVTGGPPAPGVWWWMILAPIFLGVLLFLPLVLNRCGVALLAGPTEVWVGIDPCEWASWVASALDVFLVPDPSVWISQGW